MQNWRQDALSELQQRKNLISDGTSRGTDQRSMREANRSVALTWPWMD
jgi:hypothetical protein